MIQKDLIMKDKKVMSSLRMEASDEPDVALYCLESAIFLFNVVDENIFYHGPDFDNWIFSTMKIVFCNWVLVLKRIP